MSLGTSDKVFLAIALTDFAGILIWIGTSLHLAYTKMDLMLGHLKNSPAISVWAPMRDGGPWGKLLLVGGISGLVTFPNFQLKRGQLNPEDLASFPPGLKRKLIFLQWSMIGLLLVMVTFGAAVMLDFI